jgi:hypothetical protein
MYSELQIHTCNSDTNCIGRKKGEGFVQKQDVPEVALQILYSLSRDTIFIYNQSRTEIDNGKLR